MNAVRTFVGTNDARFPPRRQKQSVPRFAFSTSVVVVGYGFGFWFRLLVELDGWMWMDGLNGWMDGWIVGSWLGRGNAIRCQSEKPIMMIIVVVVVVVVSSLHHVEDATRCIFVLWYCSWWTCGMD